MDYRAWQLQVVRYLDKLLSRKAAGRGSRKVLLKKLKLRTTFFGDLRRRLKRPKSRIPLNKVFPIIESLGEKPAILLYEAAREIDRELPELTKQEPKVVPSSFVAGVLDLLEGLERPKITKPRDLGNETGFITWQRFCRLVTSQPEIVLQQAHAALHLAAPALRPRILSVIAAALRKTSDLEGARQLYRRARKEAEAIGDHWAMANIVHWEGRVALDMGEPECAVQLTLEAIGTYEIIGDQVGLGRALIGHGQHLAHLEKFDRARFSFRRALQILPYSEADYRIAAAMNLAQIANKSGDLEEALNWARAARHTQGVVDQGVLIECYEVQGEIAFELDRLGEAEDAFHECRRYYWETGMHLECAYTTVWLCETLLAQRRPAEVAALAKASTQLIGHLRNSRVASGVIATLARQTVDGQSIEQQQLRGMRETLKGLRYARTRDGRSEV